ncbi:hypothetical protein NE237_006412 [Protea cynaroides]|uniref:Uncharacterized protein n=1 Tax=Protea cynaroides TaxID=273540 RepID=A0A9Q0KMC4_9MAGN|nr:hypothetical protein NE237_006412 [Protea cynaroides]
MGLGLGGRKLSFDILTNDGFINDEFLLYRSNSDPLRQNGRNRDLSSLRDQTNRRKQKNKSSKKISPSIEEVPITDKAVDSVFDNHEVFYYENGSCTNGLVSNFTTVSPSMSLSLSLTDLTMVDPVSSEIRLNQSRFLLVRQFATLVQYCKYLEEGKQSWLHHKKEVMWRLSRLEQQLESEKNNKKMKKMEEVKTKIRCLREEEDGIRMYHVYILRGRLPEIEFEHPNCVPLSSNAEFSIDYKGLGYT